MGTPVILNVLFLFGSLDDQEDISSVVILTAQAALTDGGRQIVFINLQSISTGSSVLPQSEKRGRRRRGGGSSEWY